MACCGWRIACSVEKVEEADVIMSGSKKTSEENWDIVKLAIDEIVKERMRQRDLKIKHLYESLIDANEDSIRSSHSVDSHIHRGKNAYELISSNIEGRPSTLNEKKTSTCIHHINVEQINSCC